jgi:DNA (cytosine-5)-methyltransferase 1
VRGNGGRPVFVDAFAGCGGLSLGLLRAGWQGLFAVEKDRFAFATLKENLISETGRYSFDWPVWLEKKPWTIEGLEQNHRKELRKLRGTVDLLAGGPPCQGFSSAGRRRHTDPRNQLIERYLELVNLLQPRMVLIENVRGMTYDFVSSERTSRRNFAEELIFSLLKRYHVYAEVVRCSMFGVPQQRPRYFIVGMSKEEFEKHTECDGPFTRLRMLKAKFLAARGLKARVTCKQAISDLELRRTGKGPCFDTVGYESLLTIDPRTYYQAYMRDGHMGPISDTRLAKHRPHIVDRFQRIIDECTMANRLNVQLNREMRDRHGIRKMATRVLDPSKPSPTITSMPDDLLHYCEPRTLTVRENARLQTFPDWFVFKGKYTTGGHLRAREVPRFTQVANAVPPLLAEMWGETLMSYCVRTSVAKRRAA